MPGVTLAALFLLTLSAHASSFRHERTLTPGGRGSNRVDVDVTLLAGAKPDLRDLRLFDAQQREVGYLLVAPTGEPHWVDGDTLPIVATKKTSGFEVDLGRSTNVDRLKLDGIVTPFLKRATLEGSGDRAHWTLLADATVFDLPDEELRRTEIAFAPGQYRYLRLTWDNRSSARVTGAIAVTAREHDSTARPEPLRFNTPFLKRPSEPGKSRYRIQLPGPHLPIAAIEVEVARGNVFRGAIVMEPRLGNGEVVPLTLGSATLKRAEREGVVATEMDIPIAAPEGRDLDLVLDDGNNPPLAIAAIRARLVPQPWIYFESPDGAPLQARYGDESAIPPLYDLEASRPYVASRQTATAVWSEGQAIMLVPSGEAGLPALHGGPIDREQFRVNRKLPEAPVGLTVLLLDAHVLARDNDLADVRLADANGRQVPYLVEQRAEPLAVKLAIPARREEKTSSVYRFTLPYDTWPVGTRLVLTTSARVFDRNVIVRTVAEDHRNRRSSILASATWRSADPDLLPPVLTFDDALRNTRAIEVVIDEGDNAPLPLQSAQLLLPSSALRFHHPGTPLFLLYGNRAASAPRYDLALLAPRLFGESARELALPANAPAPAPEGDDGDRKLFWLGIVIAAAVLIALLVRLLLFGAEKATT